MIYDLITNMTINQQRMLLRLLSEGGGPDIGVREPRRPNPESPGDAIAQQIDYDDL